MCLDIHIGQQGLYLIMGSITCCSLESLPGSPCISDAGNAVMQKMDFQSDLM